MMGIRFTRVNPRGTFKLFDKLINEDDYVDQQRMADGTSYQTQWSVGITVN